MSAPYSIVNTGNSLPFAVPRSTPIDCGKSDIPPVVDNSQVYKAMRREHEIQAMRDIQGEVIGQGKPEFWR